MARQTGVDRPSRSPKEMIEGIAKKHDGELA